MRQRVVVSCPIDTYSGYGARSRDFVQALINLDKYDIEILAQKWGNCRAGYLSDHDQEEMESMIIGQVTSKPDIWVQITIPNEFQPVGHYNIGVTAGIETTLCHATWIQGLNRMDLNLVSSEHSKKVFTESNFEKVDPKTNQVAEQISLMKPVEVLFEGGDIEKYFPKKLESSSDVLKELNNIKESFGFLVCGHWMQGELGHDRKNIGYTIKSFLETFKNYRKNKPALILKIQEVGTGMMDRSKILKKIDAIKSNISGSLPNIYLLHGEMTDAEVNELYNHPKVKCMVSHTRGEGFGRPLLEFSLIGKPIICSGWSGQVDFLGKDLNILIGGKLEKIDKSSVQDKILIPESSWFMPDDGQTNHAYKEVIKNYKKWVVNAKKLKFRNRNEFSFKSMEELLKKYFKKYVKEAPKQVDLKLPTLELPKLK